MDRTATPQTPWLVMIPLGLPIFMVNADLTVVNLALPHMAKDLHVGLNSVQWVVNGYSIAAAAFVVFGGRLADILGRKKVFIITTIVFLAGSAAAGLAQRPYQLIVSRIVQGAGMVVFPVAMAIIYVLFAGKQRNLALGIAAGISGVSAAMGPTVGGIILHLLSWRWIFFINIPLGAVALITALAWIRESEPETGRSLDYAGQALLSVGLLAVLLALNEVQAWGYDSPLFLFGLFGGMALLSVFWVVECRTREPLLDPNLFRNGSFAAANLVRVLFQYVCFGVFFLVSLYAQNILFRTSLGTGLTLLWLTVTVGVLSPFAGRCMDRTGLRLPISTGMLLIGISCGMLSCVSPESNLSRLFLPLMIFGIGASAIFPGSVSAALASLPEGKAGVASGALYMGAWLGGAVGVAVSGLVIHVHAVDFMARRLALRNIDLTVLQRHCVDQVVTGAHSARRILSELPQQVAGQIMSDARDAFVSAFAFNMRIYVVLCLVAALAAWFIRPDAGRKRD